MICHKIGETFLWHEYSDTTVRLKVVKDDYDIGCCKCYFENCAALPSEIQDKVEPCTVSLRPDHTDIHFELVE